MENKKEMLNEIIILWKRTILKMFYFGGYKDWKKVINLLQKYECVDKKNNQLLEIATTKAIKGSVPGNMAKSLKLCKKLYSLEFNEEWKK